LKRQALSQRVDKVLDDELAGFRNDGLGVELHPLNARVLPVPHAHDRLVLRPGRHLQLVLRGESATGRLSCYAEA